MCSEIQYYCNPFKYNDYQEYLVTATRVGRSQDDLLAYIHLRLGLAKDDSIIPENQGSTAIIRKFRLYENDNVEVLRIYSVLLKTLLKSISIRK